MSVNEKKVPKRRFKEFQNAGAWEQRKLGDLGYFYYGKSAPKWSVTKDAKTPCVRYGELYTKHSEKIDKIYSYTNIPTDYLKFSTGNEVLVPRVGEDPLDFANCAWLSIPGVAIGEMISVYNTEQNPLFTSYMFNSKLKYEFAKRVEGGNVSNLYYVYLENILISFPTLAEQEKIASFLNELTKLITLHKRKLDKLKSLKKAYLTDMFPAEGESKPKLRFSGFTDDWEQCKFSELADIRRGLTYSPNNLVESGIRVLRSSNIFEDAFTYSENDVFVDENSVNIPYVKNGDILITSANGSTRLVGKHAIIRDLANDSAVHGGFMLLATSPNSEFLNASMSSAWYSKFVSLYVAGGNGAIGNLNKNDLDNQIILVPDEKEQQEIGTFFKQLDNLITLHQRKLEKLQNIKKAYLNEMFI